MVAGFLVVLWFGWRFCIGAGGWVGDLRLIVVFCGLVLGVCWLMLGLVCFVVGLVCVVGVMLLFGVACLGDDDCCELFGGDVLVCMPAVSLGDLILGMGCAIYASD